MSAGRARINEGAGRAEINESFTASGKARRPLMLFGYISRRIAMRRRWRDGFFTIRQNHIAILPNRFGVYAGFLVLASFAMGYKVQNNFILLAVIFLFLVFMLSLIASVRNLQGITVQVQAEPVYFEGDNHFIRLVFKKDQPAFNLIVQNDRVQMQIELSQNIETVRLPVGRLARGVHKIPQIKLQTGFPFGIARAWLWLTPPDLLIVAPHPSSRPLTHYPRQAINAGFGEDGPDRRADRIEEPGDLRDYQPGDAPSKIDWKRFAATRETMVREQQADRASTLLLQQDKGAREAALQFLCGGLQVAENAGLAALMTLDGADYFIADKTSRLRAYHVLARA